MLADFIIGYYRRHRIQQKEYSKCEKNTKTP